MKHRPPFTFRNSFLSVSISWHWWHYWIYCQGFHENTKTLGRSHWSLGSEGNVLACVKPEASQNLTQSDFQTAAAPPRHRKGQNLFPHLSSCPFCCVGHRLPPQIQSRRTSELPPHLLRVQHKGAVSRGRRATHNSNQDHCPLCPTPLHLLKPTLHASH